MSVCTPSDVSEASDVCFTACAALVLVVWLVPTPAEACGGLFPSTDGDPVEQTTERIAFVDSGDNETTALLELAYAGEGSEFAWLLPVPGGLKGEDVEVSSSTVFERLEDATRPSYTFEESVKGACASSRDNPNLGSGSGGSGGPPADAGAGYGDSGVDVVDRGNVGPYDFAIIQVDGNRSNPARRAESWLSDNGYSANNLETGTLNSYFREGMNLLAVKLSKESDVGRIRPLRLTMPGETLEVPIKMAAVAARKDTGVRIWFGGPARAVATNYESVRLNPAVVDWFDPWSNYEAVVSAAVDEAGGRAFVTELARPSSILEGELFRSAERSSWEELNRPDYYDNRQGRLIVEGLSAYGDWDGISRVIQRSVPIPSGATLEDVRRSPGRYFDENSENVQNFVPENFLDLLETNVVDPVRSASSLLTSIDRITRLYTTLSPDEMTEDPQFAFNTSLGPVSPTHEATRTLYCRPGVFESRANWSTTLGSDFEVRGRSEQWPFVPDGNMPAALRVVQHGESGSGSVETDNTETIRSRLQEHNRSVSLRASKGNDSSPAAPTSQDSSDASGCGCGQTDGPMPVGLLAMCLAMLGVRIGWRRR